MYRRYLLPLVLESELQGALKKFRQLCGANFNLHAQMPGYTSEKLDFNFDLSRGQLVSPDSGNLSVNQNHGRNPSLIAINAFIKFSFQEMLFESMGQQVDVKIGKQMDGRLRERD